MSAAATLAVLSSAAAAALCPGGVRLPTPASALPTTRRLLPPLVVVVVGVVASLQGRHVVLAAIICGACVAVLRLISRSRARRVSDARRLRLIEAGEALASELRAGQPPLTALERTAEVWPELDPVAAACRLDADVPHAFRRLSETPGADALVEVAAAWQVSQSTGAGLAQALDRVVQMARGQQATRRVVSAELASAQATARMVAILPVPVLVLSDGSGADAWHFLLDTPAGLLCLATGLTLAFAGMWWIDSIVARVDRGVQ